MVSGPRQQEQDIAEAKNKGHLGGAEATGCLLESSGKTMPLNLADQEWAAAVWGNYDSNLEFLRRVAAVLKSRSAILEIGCGKGLLLDTLQKLGHEVTGIDVDPGAIAACRASFPDLDARVGSGASIGFPAGSFDVVLSFDVFEHIRDSDGHLREVRRVLRPDGVYLLQTPNKWTNVPFEILRYWRKFRMPPRAAYRELLKEHCSLHNYWELRRRFARNGFQTTFVNIPVVNEHFRQKMHTYFGIAAAPLLAVFNPDRFPGPLRTNFYLKAHAVH
jgi:SAM-dependent methyltransferase